MTEPRGPRKVEKNASLADAPTTGLSLHQGFQVLAGVMVVIAVVVTFLFAQPSSAKDVTTASGSQPSPQNAAASVTPTGGTTEATVEVEGMSFTPADIEVPVGNELVITFHNTGDQRHDLVLGNGTQTETIAPGATATLKAGVIDASMEGWCSLPGHRQMGMSLTIRATGAAAEASGTGGMQGMSGMHAGTSAGSSAAVPSAADLQKFAKKAEPADAKLGNLDDSTVRNYTLTVTEGTQQLTNELTREVWTYNGTAPGPVLHGRVGDVFHVKLVNKGTMGHSVDFHAGRNNPDDVMRTIDPGESLDYTFTADHAGIWLYHCSTVPMSNHIANGMHGAVVIEPEGLSEVEEQYVLVQSEMYLGADGEPADATKVAAGIPDIVAFNGRAFQYDSHPLTATAGKKIRIWVLDAGPNAAWSFHIVGTQFSTVWREGSYLIRDNNGSGMTEGQSAAQVLSLQAAEGGFVELTVPEPGNYPIVNHQMSLAEKGAHGVLKVTK